MDKDFDEGMAPALHTTEHETASVPVKHNFKLPPVSSSEALSTKIVFNQINGIPNSTEPIITTDSGNDSASDFRTFEYKVSSKSVMSYPNNGASGDHITSPITNKGFERSSVGHESLSVMCGAGDGNHVDEGITSKTNGWQDHRERVDVLHKGVYEKSNADKNIDVNERTRTNGMHSLAFNCKSVATVDHYTTNGNNFSVNPETCNMAKESIDEKWSKIALPGEETIKHKLLETFTWKEAPSNVSSDDITAFATSKLGCKNDNDISSINSGSTSVSTQEDCHNGSNVPRTLTLSCGVQMNATVVNPLNTEGVTASKCEDEATIDSAACPNGASLMINAEKACKTASGRYDGASCDDDIIPLENNDTTMSMVNSIATTSVVNAKPNYSCNVNNTTSASTKAESKSAKDFDDIQCDLDITSEQFDSKSCEYNFETTSTAEKSIDVITGNQTCTTSSLCNVSCTTDGNNTVNALVASSIHTDNNTSSTVCKPEDITEATLTPHLSESNQEGCITNQHIKPCTFKEKVVPGDVLLASDTVNDSSSLIVFGNNNISCTTTCTISNAQKANLFLKESLFSQTPTSTNHLYTGSEPLLKQKSDHKLTTQTAQVYDVKNPIFSHSAHTTEIQNSSIQNENSFSDKTNDHSEDLASLAHGLINGEHMQHLSSRLTKTLQEVAASLTRTQELNCESENNTAKAGPVIESSSFPSLDTVAELEYCEESVGKILNSHEIQTQHNLQFAQASQHRLDLEKRIASLCIRLNTLRAKGINRCTRRQLKMLTAHKPDYEDIKTLSSDKLCSLFWKRKCEQSESSKLETRDQLAKSTKPGDDKMKTQNSPGKQGSSEKISEISGILRKEINNTRVRFDPDLTESSSDEEMSEMTSSISTNDVDHNLFRDHLQLKSKDDILIQHTRLRKWAKDRISVARRWTWLQGQVLELEFKIRQHNEFFRQLRAGKGEVCLGYQQVTPDIPNMKDDESNIVTPRQLPTSENLGQTDSTPNENTTIAKGSLSDATDLYTVAEQLSHNNKHHLSSAVNGLEGHILNSSARTRPLKHPLRRRKLVRAADVSTLLNESMKFATVSSDSCIMKEEFAKQTPFHRGDGRPINPSYLTQASRAAQHDHSYHRILSTPEDTSISLRLNASVMVNSKRLAGKSKRTARAGKRSKRKQKEEKLKTRQKSTTLFLDRADKLMRSMSALHRNSSVEDRSHPYDQRKRRQSVQLMAEFNKRQRLISTDSDAENFHHLTGIGVTSLDSSLQYQAALKRKRASEQAYDINNIVIPHGLSTTRIEKLQYKEILTPGWRQKNEASSQKQGEQDNADVEAEEQSDVAYQLRHDRYEIMEKKKYMAYMEWNMNKRNGTRSMSRANMPPKSPFEQASFFDSHLLRSSPTGFNPPNELPSPVSPEPLAVVRSRRSSSDHSSHNITSTSERHRMQGSLSSEDGSLFLRENSNYEAWEIRVFPLSDTDYVELTKEPSLQEMKQAKVPDTDSEVKFHPTTHKPLGPDTNTAPKHKTPILSERSVSKRRRTNSSLSVLHRDEEASDGSIHSLVKTKSVKQDRSYVTTKTKPTSPVASVTHSRRHKPINRDQDFYFYSELDPDPESDYSTESENESLISADEKLPAHSHTSNRNRNTRGDSWVLKSMPGEWTSGGSGPSDDDATGESAKKAPLLLKIRKR